MNFQGLSVGYQNIHGLHDNLGCKASKLETSLKNDIEICSEIWGCECNLAFDDYLIEIIEPQKHEGGKDVTNFCKGHTPLLIKGDFNCRTGILNEIYEVQDLRGQLSWWTRMATR